MIVFRAQSNIDFLCEGSGNRSRQGSHHAWLRKTYREFWVLQLLNQNSQELSRPSLDLMGLPFLRFRMHIKFKV